MFILGCNKEIELTQTVGTQLASIEYRGNGGSWIETFRYDTDDRLVSIESNRSPGSRYEMNYQDDRLVEYSIIQKDNEIQTSRDSLLYNDADQLHAIHQFHHDQRGRSNLNIIYEFNYDSQGQPMEKRIFSVTSGEYFWYEKFYWEKGNVVRMEYYNDEEELMYEFFYTYDDKSSPIQSVPYFRTEPVMWSKNNVVSMRWTDHAGNLDIVCQPCVTSYEYNLSDYPVWIESDDENIVPHIAQGNDELILKYR